MAGFCRNCGRALKEGASFCPGCGERVQQAKIQDVAGKGRKVAGAGKKRIICMIAVLLLLVVGGIGFFGKEDKADSAESIVSEPISVADATDKDSEPTKSPLTLTKEDVKKYGFSDNILATTYGQNADGYLAIEGGKGVRILLIDQKNQRVATVSPRMPLSKYAQQRNEKTPEAMIADFLVLNDTHGPDDKYGTWQGANHRLTIHASYRFDGAGQVIPGRLTSGEGKNPSHFQGFLQEQKNVDMANLFLLEALPLLENATQNHVTI